MDIFVTFIGLWALFYICWIIISFGLGLFLAIKNHTAEFAPIVAIVWGIYTGWAVSLVIVLALIILSFVL